MLCLFLENIHSRQDIYQKDVSIFSVDNKDKQCLKATEYPKRNKLHFVLILSQRRYRVVETADSGILVINVFCLCSD